LSRRAKTAVSSEEVARLARLSRLTMTRPEEERLRGELSSILEYFRVVDGVGTPKAETRLKQDASSLRTDEVKPSDPEGVLRGVPHKKGRLVKAPRVF
jgi:aspartyl/glutamyl-tRNA(Asn/Gln) amidotransferase C subunit